MELISRFPPELWLQIIEQLGTKDIKALSTTCSTMSKWLAPRLFSYLRLSSETTDLMPMVSLLKRHGHVVKKITYECFLFTIKDDDEKGVSGLSPILEDLLAGKGMPNLKIIALGFHLQSNYYDWDKTVQRAKHRNCVKNAIIEFHSHRESAQEVQMAESTSRWRANFQRVFDAVSQNTALQHLEIQELFPRQCSIWRTLKWQKFLGRLSSLKLGIWGGNIEGWHSSRESGYQEFIGQLRPNFFKHLAGLKQLHLISDRHNALGSKGEHYNPLPISAEDFPNLEDLELENCFIDSVLQDFLSVRKDTIRRLAFTNCLSDWYGGTESDGNDDSDSDSESAYYPTSWATFFHSIRNLQPPNLIQFIVTYPDVTLDYRQYYDEKDQIKWGYNGETRAQVEAIYEQLRENKNLKLFTYGTVDDVYGGTHVTGHCTKNYFEKGEDQREYDALMQFVAENVEKSKERRRHRKLVILA